MERLQLLKPVLSIRLPERLRRVTAVTAGLRQTGKETTEQLQQIIHHTLTHISYAAQDATLVLMRTGLQVATDLQRFFLADISLYSCLQYAACLVKQAFTSLKK